MGRKWFWLLFLVIPLGCLVWWWFDRRRRSVTAGDDQRRLPVADRPGMLVLSPGVGETIERRVPSEQPEGLTRLAPAVEVEPAIPSMEPPRTDDLKRIEGIGPKIAAVLAEAGVITFAQLAAAEVADLSRILREAGLRLANPATWPEQAALAAAGDWAALRALQDRIRAGRRDAS